MSRIGSQPITVPEKVEVKISSGQIGVKGPKGALEFCIPNKIIVASESGVIKLTRSGDDRESRSLHGLCRSLIANMIQGVNQGFERELEINGVGYRAELKGSELHLALGFSHPVIYPLPQGISAKVDGRKTKIVLSGVDKQLLGNTAAKIRSFRPPEPYRGKGVKFAEERIQRKEGKSAGK